MDIFLHIGKEDIVASVPAPLTSFRRFPKKTSFTAKAKRKKRHWSHQSYSYFWMNLPEKAHAAPSTIFFLTTQPPHGKRSHQPASLSEGLHSSGAERRRGSFGEAALSHQKGKRRGKKKKKKIVLKVQRELWARRSRSVLLRCRGALWLLQVTEAQRELRGN